MYLLCAVILAKQYSICTASYAILPTMCCTMAWLEFGRQALPGQAMIANVAVHADA